MRCARRCSTPASPIACSRWQRPTTADEVNELFRSRRGRAARRHPRLRDAAAGLGRLLQRHAQLDRRRPEHHGHRRHAAQGLCLVRQRDRLCLPHGRSRQHRDRAGAPDVGRAQLPDRHRELLGLHADRRRAAHAGAAALLQPRLHAVHAGVPVPALRDGRHLRQSRRRLAGHALRHSAHADDRPGAADRRPAAAVGARSGLERGAVGRLGGRRARHRRRRQGHHQDRLEIRDQGDVGRRLGPAVQMGRLVHRLEERDEGRRLLRRRPAAGNRRLQAARCG